MSGEQVDGVIRRFRTGGRRRYGGIVGRQTALRLPFHVA